MDWLDKAADGFKKNIDENVEYEKLEVEFEKVYPSLVNELWEMFEKTFEEVKAKFEEKCGFEANGNNMRLVIGDVMIEGIADNGKYMGGFHGSAKIGYEAIGTSGGPKLPVQDLLIFDIENPTWVSRGVRNGQNKNIPFEQKDVEEIFKTALWKYIK